MENLDDLLKLDNNVITQEEFDSRKSKNEYIYISMGCVL